MARLCFICELALKLNSPWTIWMIKRASAWYSNSNNVAVIKPFDVQ